LRIRDDRALLKRTPSHTGTQTHTLTHTPTHTGTHTHPHTHTLTHKEAHTDTRTPRGVTTRQWEASSNQNQLHKKLLAFPSAAPSLHGWVMLNRRSGRFAAPLAVMQATETENFA